MIRTQSALNPHRVRTESARIPRTARAGFTPDFCIDFEGFLGIY